MCEQYQNNSTLTIQEMSGVQVIEHPLQPQPIKINFSIEETDRYNDCEHCGATGDTNFFSTGGYCRCTTCKGTGRKQIN